MQIRITGYLTLRGVVGKKRLVKVDTGQVTLKDLVQRLALEFDSEFADAVLDPQDDMGINRDVSILVNGRHYTHLPDRLETKLADGDEVALFPPVAGG